MEYSEATSKIKDGAQVPVMAEYYLKMHYIDPDLANDFMPINHALKKAIQLALQYFAYKNEEVKDWYPIRSQVWWPAEYLHIPLIIPLRFFSKLDVLC